MKKDVLIKISGLHSEDGEDGNMELMVNGTFMKSDEKIYLSYEETDSDGSVHKCRLKLGKNEVVYSKEGLMTTKLYYCVGEPYESVISTPYGRLEAEIVTEKIEYAENPNALTDVRIDYLLSINSEYVTNCSMNVVAEEITK